MTSDTRDRVRSVRILRWIIGIAAVELVAMVMIGVMLR